MFKNLKVLCLYGNGIKTIDSSLLSGLNQLNYLSLGGNGIQSVGKGFLTFINETCIQYFYFNSLDQCILNVNMVEQCSRFSSTTCNIVSIWNSKQKKNSVQADTFNINIKIENINK